MGIGLSGEGSCSCDPLGSAELGSLGMMLLLSKLSKPTGELLFLLSYLVLMRKFELLIPWCLENRVCDLPQLRLWLGSLASC